MGRRQRAFLLYACCAGLAGSWSVGRAWAQQTNAAGTTALLTQPAVITADQLVHDRDLDTVTASGHIEVDQAGRTLLADSLSYNLRQDVIVASGRVSMTDVSGNVTFADYVELSGDLKNAVARGIRELLVDNSRLYAASSRRVEGTEEIMTNAVYTACVPCTKDPDEAPLWDIRAREIDHDETTHEIQYRDAVMEAKGIPVFYLPYFFNADPQATNQSGLLWPGMVNNRIIGTAFQWPYYQIVSPNQDIVIDPMVSTKEGPALSVSDRYRGLTSGIDTLVSAGEEPSTNAGTSQTLGWQINSTASFDLNDSWRAGWNAARTSDRDYLRYYDYPVSQPFLVTHPYVEGFGEHNYFSVEGYGFQSETDTSTVPTPGVPTAIPTVLPMIAYDYTGDPSRQGAFWTFDAHASSVNRSAGQQSDRRINTLSGWHMPYNAPDGEVYDFATSLRADFYNSTNLLDQSPGIVDASRVLPQASLNWRFPMAKVGARGDQILTPILMGNLGPVGGNSAKIPNEDSLDFELDDANIFSPNPSAGYDRVYTAPRIAYGGEYQINDRGGASLDFLLGQSYQPRLEQVFQQGTGLDDHISDIVGKVQAAPSPNFDLYYRFRVDHSDFAMRRSEVGFSAGPKALNLQLSYVFLGQLNPDSPYPEREQIAGTLGAQLSRYWWAQAYTNQNLGVGAEPLESGARIVYDDECLTVGLEAGVRHTYVNTTLTGHYIMLEINLKTLTQFPVSL